ncbi:hypothetical protein J6590_009780 [Homalodisca vitripennis]|nr:hypothetical protein J6590_009780 [Homalodisca vitripennis]
MALTCRVQYLNDIDPFAYTTNFPEPPRPPVHTFSCSLPLINQIAAVHRLLRAPHRCSVVLVPGRPALVNKDSCLLYLPTSRHWPTDCQLLTSHMTAVSVHTQELGKM